MQNKSPRPIRGIFHKITENFKRVERVLTTRFSLILFSVGFQKIFKNSEKFQDFVQKSRSSRKIRIIRKNSNKSIQTITKINNIEFKKLQKEYSEILENNGKVRETLYCIRAGVTLTLEECDFLYKAITLHYKMQMMVEEELYFKGVMDAYYYFQRLGVIKNDNFT